MELAKFLAVLVATGLDKRLYWVRDYCSVFANYETSNYFILKSKGFYQFFNTQYFMQEIFIR